MFIKSILGLLLVVWVLTLPFILWYKIARKFEQIAIAKGYPDVHAFAMCFWLGIIGHLYVIALPNANLDNRVVQHQKEVLDALQNLKPEKTTNNQIDECDE